MELGGAGRAVIRSMSVVGERRRGGPGREANKKSLTVLCVHIGGSDVGHLANNKRARVSLTLRLICRYFLRSLRPFLTCIYETLLDLEIYKMMVKTASDSGVRNKLLRAPRESGNIN